MSTTRVLSLTKRSQPFLTMTVRQNDHILLSRLMAEGKLTAKNFIIDARNHERQAALRIEARQENRSVWLDTQSLEISLPYGASAGHHLLPWYKFAASRKPLPTAGLVAYASAISKFAAEGSYNRILVPTHFLSDFHTGLFEVDCAMAEELRVALDHLQLANAGLVYPLTISSRLLHDDAVRASIARTLAKLPIDLVSIRLHPFGKNSGPNVIRAVLNALNDLRSCNHAIVVERAGYVGSLLYAHGAVDAVEMGVVVGDSFDLNSRFKPRKGDGGGTYQGIYLESLNTTVPLSAADALMRGNQGKSRYACSHADCCPDGMRSMLKDSRRHTILAQQRQLNRLTAVPPADRPEFFVNMILAPACDMLSRAGEVIEALHETHKRHLSIKEMLKSLRDEDGKKAYSRQSNMEQLAPAGRVVKFPSKDYLGKSKP